MSRLPLESALPAAYPSPTLDPERERLLHARLDAVFADARADAARRESKRAKNKRSPARIVLGIALVGSFGYVGQSLLASMLKRNLIDVYYFQSNAPIHEIVYRIKDGKPIQKYEYWKKIHPSTKSMHGTQERLKVDYDWVCVYPIRKSNLAVKRTAMITDEVSTYSYISRATKLAFTEKRRFSGIKFSHGNVFVCIETGPLENIWFDLRTRRFRVINTFDSNGNVVLKNEYHYDETPPPGIFDPKRLKAMAR